MTRRVEKIEVLNGVFGGQFLGRMPDGKTIFLPFTLPGETVSAEITEEKRDFYRGRVLEVLSASPHRITPRCPHFTHCGGCHYQHLAYADQLLLKRAIVIDQLKRVGKIETPPVAEVIPSAVQWNYRNTVQFHLSPQGKLGFRAPASSETIEITECHLPLAEINDLWPRLHLAAGCGIERMTLRLGSEGEALLGLESEVDLPPELELDMPLSVVHLGRDSEFVLSGDSYSVMRVRETDFRVSARSFFQVNLPQAEAMLEHIFSKAAFSAEMTVMDLYCGVGLFSRFIAPRVKVLIGVELAESACDDFAANLEEFENVSLYIGKVEEIISHIEVEPDVILVDPPRAGMDRSALAWIAGSSARQLIYISCDPTTLARDVRVLLAQGWELQNVQPFDLFPQTYHVETVVLMSRKDK